MGGIRGLSLAKYLVYPVISDSFGENLNPGQPSGESELVFHTPNA